MPSNKAEVSAESIHQTAMHHPDGSTTAINIKGPNVGAGVVFELMVKVNKPWAEIKGGI